jgi:hypothetical protein
MLEVVSMALGAGLAVSIRMAAGAILTLLVLAAPVLACRGAKNHKILLDAIPPAADRSEVIARVEIVEVQIRELPGLRPFHVARARVLQSIRGTADGDRSNRCRGDHMRWWTRSERGWTQGFHRRTLPPDRR